MWQTCEHMKHNVLHSLQTLAPTSPEYKTGSKPFRQLAANRCLRGFINMSGIDTIFECVCVCV